MLKIDQHLFRTGVPAIDNQHEQYLLLLDHLFDLTAQTRVDPASVDAALDQVLAYAVEHFDTEEALMRAVDYPGYKAHRRKHDEFRRATDHWCGGAAARAIPPDQFPVLLTTWLVTWFCEQTQVHDKALAHFLKQRRAEARG